MSLKTRPASSLTASTAGLMPEISSRKTRAGFGCCFSRGKIQRQRGAQPRFRIVAGSRCGSRHLLVQMADDMVIGGDQQGFAVGEGLIEIALGELGGLTDRLHRRDAIADLAIDLDCRVDQLEPPLAAAFVGVHAAIEAGFPAACHEAY